MNFLERNLEDIIYENSLTKEGREKLKERGLNIEGKLFRQVDLGGFGRIDLLECGFVRNQEGTLVPYSIIYELKRNEISVDTIAQACRYVCGIKNHLFAFLPKEMIGKRGKPVIWIKLIGERFNGSSEFRFLYPNMRRLVDAYTFSYDIDGIKFNPIDNDISFSYIDIAHNDDFADAYIAPSFSMLRDVLEPCRNAKHS